MNLIEQPADANLVSIRDVGLAHTPACQASHNKAEVPLQEQQTYRPPPTHRSIVYDKAASEALRLKLCDLARRYTSGGMSVAALHFTASDLIHEQRNCWGECLYRLHVVGVNEEYYEDMRKHHVSRPLLAAALPPAHR